jgi:hypothetical protein
MSKTMSPTGRTLNLLRAEGFEVDVVERRLPHCHIAVDLFGMFDLIAVRSDTLGTLGIQATSASNHAQRVKKLLMNPVLPVWLGSGNRAEVISWRQDREGNWVARRQAVLGREGGARVRPAYLLRS